MRKSIRDGMRCLKVLERLQRYLTALQSAATDRAAPPDQLDTHDQQDDLTDDECVAVRGTSGDPSDDEWDRVGAIVGSIVAQSIGLDQVWFRPVVSATTCDRAAGRNYTRSPTTPGEYIMTDALVEELLQAAVMAPQPARLLCQGETPAVRGVDRCMGSAMRRARRVL